MISWLLLVPPAVPVAIVALLVLVVPRRVGIVIAGLSLAGVSVWSLIVPTGTGLVVQFLNLDVLLVEVDQIRRLLGLIFGGFGVAAVGFVAIADADRYHLAIGLAYVAAALLAVFAGDWLGLLLGWELLAIFSTLLVWLHGGDAIRAGYRYALWHGIGGGFFAAGVVGHVAIAGGGGGVGIGQSAVSTALETLQFDGTGLAAGVPTVLVGIAVAINAGVIGLHSWLPDTYPRPHVATSVFLCAYTTKTAVYAAYRLFPDGNLVLAYVGGIMTIYGASYALAQKDMRRLLSYHIQAQVGYMLAGIGIGSALGVAGGFAHLFNNILYKGLLFMIAGAIVLRTGENRLDRFGALQTTSPALLLAFLVAALSIAAAPGFNGFVSKGMVVDASVDAGEPLLRWLLLAGAVGTVMSFAKFGYYAFFKGRSTTVRAASRLEWGVYGAIALACIGFGLRYEWLFALLPATEAWTTTPYSMGHLQEAVAILVVGLVGFVLARPLFDRVHGGIDIDRAIDPIAFYGTRVVSAVVETVASALDRSTASAAWTALERMRARGGRTIVEEIADGYIRRSVAAVRSYDGRTIGDEIADRYIKAAIAAVRTPQRTMRRLLPEQYHDRYDRHRIETPFSESGIKLGIEESLLVLAAVLAFAIALALAF